MTRVFSRTTTAAYLAGLRLAGRSVVIVGGGAVSQRRLEALLDAGALVTVVAPGVTPAVAEHARLGRLNWQERPYRPGDLAGAWYVLAATNDAEVNAAVAREAEAQRTFCVRADDALDSTAWTPATAVIDGVQIGVLAGGDPRRAVRVRAAVVAALTRLVRRAA